MSGHISNCIFYDMLNYILEYCRVITEIPVHLALLNLTTVFIYTYCGCLRMLIRERPHHSGSYLFFKFYFQWFACFTLCFKLPYAAQY